MGVDRILASSEQELKAQSAKYIAEKIKGFQESHSGNFILGLSGTNGQARRSRAQEVFEALGRRDEVDWTRVRVFLVDERYGVKLEEDSNLWLVRNSLLKSLAASGVKFPEEHLLAPDTSIGSWEDCAADYERRLLDLFAAEKAKGPQLVTMGLHSDSSIGSIFPEWYQADPDRWKEATAREFKVLCTQTSKFEAPQRIAVNLRVIRSSETVMVWLKSGTDEAWQ
ncbi:unnamed protein product, partial [Polarella glacialis]